MIALKVFFNHLAKCGGTTIRRLAAEDYGQDFHVIDHSTSVAQLRLWLSKERVFIASELYEVSRECCDLLLHADGLQRIVLARSPIERFKSFCSHASRDRSGVSEGAAFWSNDVYLCMPVSAEAWFSAALLRLERNTLCCGHELYDAYDDGFALAIASQWWLASFKHYYDFRTRQFRPAELYQHLLSWRKSAFQSSHCIKTVFHSFVKQYYALVGTTDRLEEFVDRLCDLGVLSSRPLQLPCENQSSQLRHQQPQAFRLDDQKLLTKYFALAPEEFYLHLACRDHAGVDGTLG